MTKNISLRFLLVAMAFLVVFTLSYTPVLADDDEHMHDDVEMNHDDMDMSESSKLEKMQTVITLLQQLLELLEHQVEHMAMSHEDEVMMDHDDMNLDGIHIMADGSVMLGDGEVLHSATVKEDGMIVLEDGTEVEPVMDMRADSNMHMDDDHDHEAGDEVSMHIEIHEGMTHVHYTDEHGDLETFFIDVDIDEQDAVIAAIVAYTELDTDTITGLVDFDEVVIWD